MNLTKVSIIIPVYNVEKYIKTCLDSLINQTLKEIEIILIDDCGQDNSIKIGEEYAQIDDRIRIIYNDKNIGSGDSRNVGINVANGEYLAFVDPDDWVDLNFYEKLHEEAKKDNFDIVKAKRIKVYSNNRYDEQTALNNRIKKNLKAGLPLFLGFTYEHTTAIYKRYFILENNIKYLNIRNGEDNIFLLYVSYYSKSYSLIDGTFYYYRIIKTSAIHKIDKNFFISQLKRIKVEIEFLNSNNVIKHHYFLFIKRTLNILHSKIILIPENNSELSEYKNEFLKEFLKTVISLKYLNEDKIKNIINILVNDKETIIKTNNSISKKILKFFIRGKIKKKLKKIIMED